MDSILTSIKKLLGIPAEQTSFDADIIMHINAVFLDLQQIGVGPDEGFVITSAEETWDDYLGDSKELEAVKVYVHLKLKPVFDPPQGAVAMDAINRRADALEWRLNVKVDTKPISPETKPDTDSAEDYDIEVDWGDY